MQVKLRMAACNAKNLNQKWTLSSSGELKHDNTGLCLDMDEGKAGQEVAMEKCGGTKQQIWEFDFYKNGKESWRPSVP